MSNKMVGRGCSFLTIVFALLVSGSARAETQTKSSSDLAYTVSNSDLLQTHLKAAVDNLSYYNEDGWYNGGASVLTDGSYGSASRDGGCGIAGGSVTYYLETALYPSGFTVTNIDTYSGWQDNGRDDQDYVVSFRKAGSNDFTDPIAVSYKGEGGATTFIGKHVGIADINLTGVDAVRFTFPGQENGGVGYREFDVFAADPTPGYSVNGFSQDSAYDVSNADLLQTALAATDNALSLYAEDGWSNSGAGALTDGSFGGVGNTSCGISGGSVTYWLNTADCPAGYDITAIDTYAGWVNANRDDQRYTVSVRKVGSAIFEDIVTVNYTGTVSQDHVSISSLALKGVEAIRFTFPGQEIGGAGYKELDVTGSPSISTYTDVTRLSAVTQVIVSNDTSNVRITEGEGTLQAITLGAETTVIATLTQTTTAGLATIDPAAQVLALSGIYLAPSAGGLAIGTGTANGTLKSTGTSLLFSNPSPNDLTVRSVIMNGPDACALVKVGAGQLTLSGNNTYSGGTLVKTGTLQVATGGTVGSGPLSVSGSTLLIAGGTVAPTYGDVQYTNSTVNQTSGSFSCPGYVRIADSTLDLTGGTSYIGWEALLGWNGTLSTAIIGGGHVADWYLVRLSGGNATLNLQSGGTLYSDLLYNRDGVGVLAFDGGTLGMSSRRPGCSPWDWIYAESGSLSLYVKDGGAVINTENGSATINRPFLRDGASTGGLTKTGANTLTLTALSSYAGDTVIQGGTLKLSQVAIVANAGFESPVYPYGLGGWAPLTSDGVSGGWVWVFSDPFSTDKGGIAHNGSPWVDTAPQGGQVSFIQGSCTMKQTIAVPLAGTYRLSFSAANRPTMGADNLELQIDGVPITSWTAAAFNNDAVFQSYSATFSLTSGSHELKFVGTSPGGDTATAVDDVQVVKAGDSFPGSLPFSTRATVAAGAALDLNGASQTLAGLSGGGLVTNSLSSTSATLTVVSDEDTTFTGTIEGPISLVKAGTGKMMLLGENTYAGSTFVNGGLLVLGGVLGTGAYTTANTYSFSPAFHNLLRGLSPSYVSNDSVGVEGTGADTKLTDGAIVVVGNGTDDNLQTYAVGNDAVLTYTVGTATKGYDITQINIYAGWNDSGRENISLSGISYSTVAAPDTFIGIANSAVDYEGNTSIASAVLSAGGSVLAANVYAIRFNFGHQENDHVGYRELEVIGARSSLPTNTAVTVASGAVLDLNGHSQNLAGLNGDGLVTNGTLAVSGTIAPGGTNVIGTLTLSANVSLSGTLLIDAATDGSCDLLQVQGGLDLSGLTLQIQDLDQLKAGTQYVIATCAPGGLTGRFISTNLAANRSVRYDTGAGKVVLIARGFLISIR